MSNRTPLAAESHGFRFSTRDGWVLALTGFAASFLWAVPGNLGAPLLLVTLHFFLFCNVVRLDWQRELLWAASFLVVVGIRLLEGVPDWLSVSACVAPVTASLVLAEVCSPTYRGVGWLRCRRWHERRLKPSAQDCHCASQATPDDTRLSVELEAAGAEGSRDSDAVAGCDG